MQFATMKINDLVEQRIVNINVL